MKIFLASDHGGFYLKEEIKKHLSDKGYGVHDMGNIKFESKDDYPDFIFPLAQKVANEKNAYGIVFGRSGIGEAIVANKVKKIRAALCLNEKMAKKAREHNDANILSIGADYINPKTAKKITDVFIETKFSKAARHIRRVKKIEKIEKKSK